MNNGASMSHTIDFQRNVMKRNAFLLVKITMLNTFLLSSDSIDQYNSEFYLTQIYILPTQTNKLLSFSRFFHNFVYHIISLHSHIFLFLGSFCSHGTSIKCTQNHIVHKHKMYTKTTNYRV
jgi:hypothetical protein